MDRISKEQCSVLYPEGILERKKDWEFFFLVLSVSACI